MITTYWLGFKVGDWWPGDDTGLPKACGEEGPECLKCTRAKDHPVGRHIATVGYGTAAVAAWPGSHAPDDRIDVDSPPPWTGSTALVGPLTRILYAVGHGSGYVERLYDLPADTRDPRVASCFDHHPACDCREANTAEAFREWSAEVREAQGIQTAARAALLLHARSRGTGWFKDRCITCREPFPCPTRVVLQTALWPHNTREDYPL